jgi:hypothetical protein
VRLLGGEALLEGWMPKYVRILGGAGHKFAVL